MPKEIKITKEFEGTRAKNFLKKKIDIPNSALFKYIRNKRITLNGKKIKKEDELKKDDIVKIWLDSIPIKEEKKNFSKSKNLNMELLVNTSDFFVLNKKPGVVVQGAQELDESLSLHLSYLKDKWEDNDDFEYFHVHRLDKQTSGALVIAKKRDSLRELNKIFRQKQVKKKYLCLCDGRFEKKQGEVELYLYRAPEGSHEKVKISDKPKSDAKKTKSYYRIKEVFEYNNEDFSLVEVEIETGFMHQIRVHMKYLGHPIIGDKMYGNSFLNKKFENLLSRQFLHASELEFKYENTSYHIEAPLSDDLVNCLNELS